MLGYPKHILLFSGLIIVMIVNGVLLWTVPGVPITMFKIPSSVQSYVHCVHTHSVQNSIHGVQNSIHGVQKYIPCTKIHPVYKKIMT